MNLPPAHNGTYGRLVLVELGLVGRVVRDRDPAPYSL